MSLPTHSSDTVSLGERIGKKPFRMYTFFMYHNLYILQEYRWNRYETKIFDLF